MFVVVSDQVKVVVFDARAVTFSETPKSQTWHGLGQIISGSAASKKPHVVASGGVMNRLSTDR